MLQSCGKCAGMTPVASNTCSDKFANCKQLAKTMCYEKKIKSACCISCGLGKTQASSKLILFWSSSSGLPSATYFPVQARA